MNQFKKYLAIVLVLPICVIIIILASNNGRLPNIFCTGLFLILNVIFILEIVLLIRLAIDEIKKKKVK